MSSLLKYPLALIFGVLVFWFFIKRVPLRRKGNGFEFVYVEDDNSVRELDRDERDYLNTKFHGADGGRPYIKSFFWSKTPDKKIGGYIRRVKVPWWIEVKENEPSHNLK